MFLGELAGDRSPVHTFTPLLGAQLDLEPGADLTLDVDPAFEHGVLLDTGRVEVDGTVLDVADLAFQADGSKQLNIVNRGDGPARVMLLGGTPFPEQLVMWWNFVGRSHEDIATYRQMWEDNDDRFGAVTAIAARCHACPRRRFRTRRCVRDRIPGYRGGHDYRQDRRTDHRHRGVRPLQHRGRRDRPSGFTEIVDEDGQRTFPHTEVDDAFQGRGLATILIGEALQATRDAGLRIVPVCPMVANYVKKHSEFDATSSTLAGEFLDGLARYRRRGDDTGPLGRSSSPTATASYPRLSRAARGARPSAATTSAASSATSSNATPAIPTFSLPGSPSTCSVPRHWRRCASTPRSPARGDDSSWSTR